MCANGSSGKQQTPGNCRDSARMIHLCSAKVTHTKNRIWRSASVCQHHHPRRRRVSPFFPEGGSQWGPIKTPAWGLAQGKTSILVIAVWATLREQTMIISRKCRHRDLQKLKHEL